MVQTTKRTAPALPLEPGDRIRLNQKAREWTRGLVFTVDEVRAWGVICWAFPRAGEAVVVRDTGKAYYRATWDQIEEPA
jgi:hypothetical protein